MYLQAAQTSSSPVHEILTEQPSAVVTDQFQELVGELDDLLLMRMRVSYLPEFLLIVPERRKRG